MFLRLSRGSDIYVLGERKEGMGRGRKKAVRLFLFAQGGCAACCVSECVRDTLIDWSIDRRLFLQTFSRIGWIGNRFSDLVVVQINGV